MGGVAGVDIVRPDKPVMRALLRCDLFFQRRCWGLRTATVTPVAAKLSSDGQACLFRSGPQDVLEEVAVAD